MTNFDPRKKDHTQWNSDDRTYNEAMAQRDAERLLERISGSDAYKAMVARELSKQAIQRLPKANVQTQGPSDEFQAYISGKPTNQWGS